VFDVFMVVLESGCLKIWIDGEREKVVKMDSVLFGVLCCSTELVDLIGESKCISHLFCLDSVRYIRWKTCCQILLSVLANLIRNKCLMFYDTLIRAYLLRFQYEI
jgi:hypothetical protein